MAVCAHCGDDNAAGFRFCGSCGQPLSRDCTSCGFENAPTQSFCGRCGTRLAGADERVEPGAQSERRLATVLFADVVGFTSLAEESDPEAVATAVDQALRRMAHIVVAHGGTVDKYMGDSVMALFGIPSSHGDDAERAVAAAVAMRDQEGELRFSIGVNSGEVMATVVGERGELTAIGDAVNVASRLEELAAAGEILVGPLTAELIADRFVLRARDAALLKGRSVPVAVFEVVGQRGSAAAEPTAVPPLVDREADLNFLVSCWHRVTARSRAQVVLLTGDPGIGKTRIAEELAAAAADVALVVRAQCPGYGSLVGVRVGSELARGLAGSQSSDGSGAGLDEQGALRLRRLLAERASERPVLVVIDDMHNATGADLEALALLVARASELQVMVLLAGRPQPPRWLSTFAGPTTIRLEPLPFEDAVRLASSIDGAGLISAAAAQEVASESGGNPLHVRELARLLASGGQHVGPDQSQAGERVPVPASLNGVLTARLDALSFADKGVLQDVAIFSDGAQAGEVEVMAGHDVSSTLERLVTSGLLRQEPSGRYMVADPLLREVAYELLPHAARGERHRQASAVAATPIGRARHLGLAAGYLGHDATLRREAAEALAATGIDLLETTDYRAGVELLRQSIALGQGDPDVLIRLAQAETDVGNGAQAVALLDRVDPGSEPRLEAAVLHARGNSGQADPEAALKMLAEAARRWEVLGNLPKRAWALANRGNLLFQLGRIDEAAPDTEAALDIFRRSGDQAGVAAAGQQLALVKPDDPRVPDLLADGLRFAQEGDDLVKMRNALIPLAWVRYIRSQLGGEAATAEALADAEALAKISHEIGDTAFEVHGHSLAAVLHRLLGHLDEARRRIELARRVLPAGATAPFLEAAAFAVAVAGGAENTDRPAEAEDPGPIAVISDALILEALLLAGHVDAALDNLARLPLDVGPGASPVLGRLIGLVRGAALVFAGRFEAAEGSLTAAREAAGAVDSLPTSVAATALLAECRYRQSRRDDARALLAQITEDPGGIAALLRDRVRVLLGDSGLEEHCREQARSLCAPGLALDLARTA